MKLILTLFLLLSTSFLFLAGCSPEDNTNQDPLNGSCEIIKLSQLPIQIPGVVKDSDIHTYGNDIIVIVEGTNRTYIPKDLLIVKCHHAHL